MATFGTKNIHSAMWSFPKLKSIISFFKGSEAPATDTKLEDVVDELPDHVISRSGTPNQWAFDDKEPSLKTAPPRPTSATCCTPPVPRKV